MEIRLLIVLSFFINVLVNAQDTSDVQLMKSMSYMQLAGKVNCDSMNGTTVERRICLNLAFQQLDVLMNEKFKQSLAKIQNDSLQQECKEYQIAWVKHRRLQSRLAAEGWGGHMLGIVYLNHMVNMTKRRIEELDYLLDLSR